MHKIGDEETAGSAQIPFVMVSGHVFWMAKSGGNHSMHKPENVGGSKDHDRESDQLKRCRKGFDLFFQKGQVIQCGFQVRLDFFNIVSRPPKVKCVTLAAL
ncbi:MAG: hypothetical protein FWC84_03870 [Alphaproteobacteria bacterium]|nr:hypothetical protein [Alphaproteobacteria bacterium]